MYKLRFNFNQRHFFVLGLPITTLDYPAITICSQGWISNVTKKAMEYQFIEYVESSGKDMTGMTDDEIEAMRNSFLNGNITLINDISVLFFKR